jgi:ComF family protein
MSLILDLLFPRRCYGCGRPGSYFCSDCTKKFIYRPVKPGYPVGFDGTISLFNYHGPVKSAINDLKFNFVSDLGLELAALTSAALKTSFPHLLDYWHRSGFTLIPIPLHPSRARWRGFNQSGLLSSALSPLLNIPYNDNLLFRHRASLPQSLVKNRALRRHNISTSFCLDQDIIPPGKIILFDDVATTGSTLSSALSVFPLHTEAWALTIAG